MPSSIDKLESLETGLVGSTAEKAAWGGNSSANATRALVCPTLVVPDNYAPDDEPPRTGKPISHYVHSPRSRQKPQKERVLILAANSGGSCALQLGDYYTFLSLLDKLQYGNVHGYDLLLGLGNVDIDLRKTWNKVAWMQKVVSSVTVTERIRLSQFLWWRQMLVARGWNRVKPCNPHPLPHPEQPSNPLLVT